MPVRHRDPDTPPPRPRSPQGHQLRHSLKIAEFPRQTSRGPARRLVPFAPRPGRVPARAPWRQEPFEATQSHGPVKPVPLPRCKRPGGSASEFTLHPGSLPPRPPNPPPHTSEGVAGTGAAAGCEDMTCVLRVPRCPPRRVGSAGGLLAPGGCLHLHRTLQAGPLRRGEPVSAFLFVSVCCFFLVCFLLLVTQVLR